MDRNDLISLISIVVIIFCLTYIGIRLTGHSVTETAIINVSVGSSAAIRFTTNLTNFGAGTVNSGALGATINTEGVVINGSWLPVNNPLVVQNIGNVNVSLSIQSDKNASEFLGNINDAQFKYKIVPINNSCPTNNRENYGEFQKEPEIVCPVFKAQPLSDTINIHVQLYIPSNVPQGNYTATITAIGTYE